MRRRRDPINRLRAAIECLPAETRRAMLDGVRAQTAIIVGAYADRSGGVCPMLAAHRHGSRVSLLAFARAWDAYSGARRPRPATARELRTLIGLLEQSLDDAPSGPLAAAIAEHEQALARRREPSGEPAGRSPARSGADVLARKLNPAASVRRLRPPGPARAPSAG
jgi:hypothetical protein